MDTRRDYENALSSLLWRTTKIEEMKATCERQANRYSAEKLQRLREDIQELNRARAICVLSLAQSKLDAITLPRSEPAAFIDEIGQTWPLPLPELFDRKKKGLVSGYFFAFAVAASVANDLSDDYPDGSETVNTLVDFVEGVGEKLRSVRQRRH
jgi:hypothetical protein